MEQTDWVARSKREATALLAETGHVIVSTETYDPLVDLLAVAYRKGALDGMERAQEIIGQVKP